jgi:hypothetical protein
MGVIVPLAPLARSEGEFPEGGVEVWASIGEVVMIISVAVWSVVVWLVYSEYRCRCEDEWKWSDG